MYRIEMEGVDSIIIDLGKVLLNIDQERAESEFSALGIAEFELISKSEHVKKVLDDFETGGLSEPAFFRKIKGLFSVDVSLDALKNAWNAMISGIPPERVRLLRRFKSRHRLFLFSNTNETHVACLREQYRQSFGHEEFEELFEKVYYSSRYKMRKPDSRFISLILSENRLLAHKTLIIDDTIDNIELALSHGCRALHLSPPQTLEDIDWYRSDR